MTSFGRFHDHHYNIQWHYIVSLWVWTWTCEQDGIFLRIFWWCGKYMPKIFHDTQDIIFINVDRIFTKVVNYCAIWTWMNFKWMNIHLSKCDSFNFSFFFWCLRIINLNFHKTIKYNKLGFSFQTRLKCYYH
jgi:hypothetical protein